MSIPDTFDPLADLSHAKEKGVSLAPTAGGTLRTLAQEFSPTENRGTSSKEVQISEAASPGAGTGKSASNKPAGVDSFSAGTV